MESRLEEGISDLSVTGSHTDQLQPLMYFTSQAPQASFSHEFENEHGSKVYIRESHAAIVGESFEECKARIDGIVNVQQNFTVAPQSYLS